MRIARRVVTDPFVWASPTMSAMWPLILRLPRFGATRRAFTTSRPGIALHLSRERPERSGLPSVWSGSRRRSLVLLALAGFGQAVAAGVGAWLFSNALKPSGTSSPGVLFGVLLAAALTVGLLRMAERVLAEGLSQDFVHEIRLDLIRRSLFEGRSDPLGVAVARTTSDLTSVKNWISQGVAPLTAGVPLILGVGVALILLDPLLSVGLLVPVIVLASAMRVLAPVAYERTRAEGKQRGRLTEQVSETLRSAPEIGSAGGSDEELRRIGTYGQALIAASAARAKVTEAMGGATAAASGIAMSVLIGVGLLTGLPTYSIVGALTIAGFLATPIHDLGRVVEYRETYRAARRALGEMVEPVAEPAFRRADSAPVPAPAPSRDVAGSVLAAYLELSDGTMMPELAVKAGARVVVDAGSEPLTSEVLERFVRLREGCTGEIVVGGKNLAVAGPKEFRRLVGYAARGMVLRRGSLSQTVRYRAPDSDPAEVDRMLWAVKLADLVAGLPDGVDTVLASGGAPLTVAEGGRLLLAGAMLDDPPLLVFDHLDADLGGAGRAMMRRLLASYPGVVILAGDAGDQIVTPTHVWRADGVYQVAPS